MAMDGVSLTALELAVMGAIAAGDRERTVMERQIKSLRLLKRDLTGVGFYTTFEMPEDTDRLDLDRWKIEDMGHGFAHHPGLPAGALFILWIRDGRIVTLEGYTAGGDWPTDEENFRVAI
jgi:hypothetical protein